MAHDHLASVSYDEDGEKVASPIGGGDDREMPTLSFPPEGEGLSKEIYNCASELIELTNKYS